MTLHHIDDPTSTRIKDLLPFQVKDAEETTKYLGFHLKENNYCQKYWLWLFEKIEKRINFWCNKWISKEE